MNTLYQPFKLRSGSSLPQRIAMAPLTNTQSNLDGTLSEDEYNWLTRRASDGFRWISTCATFVSEEGHAWPGQLGIANETHEPGLARLAYGVKKQGAICVVQLHHAGAKAGLAPNGPLSTKSGGPENTRAATTKDILRVIADFVSAAKRAERVGFDGIELHGANGYLFNQFLAPNDNPRTDRYGGNLAGRARFLRETLQAIRSVVSKNFIVGVRLSPVDLWAQRGLLLADSVRVGQWMAEDGADYIHLSLQDASGYPPHESSNIPVARAFRDALPKDIPIFAAGGIWTQQDAQIAMDAGADVVVLGRAAIAHPDWPIVSAKNNWKPTLPAWSAEFLKSVAVGEGLVNYLKTFSGLVDGGKNVRN